MAGINRSTQNAELAREFIRCLLSYEVQKEELYDGFPVNKKALEALTEKETNGYVISVGYRGWEGSDGKDYELHAEWPPKAVRKELVEQMQKLTVPVLVDENVMKMIVEGSKLSGRQRKCRPGGGEDFQKAVGLPCRVSETVQKMLLWFCRISG